MKYSINGIRNCSIGKRAADKEPFSILCSGENGQINLRVYSPRTLFFSYRIDGMEVPQALKASHEYLCGTPVPDNGCTAVLSDEDTSFKILIGNKLGDSTEIGIEKKSGNITVSYNGKAVHGGGLGNQDTVIPRSQMRCILETGGSLPMYKFNFPLHPGDAFYGLGDKGGIPDRSKRRFRMFNRDSLGYDAEMSDPLYKSIPFFMKHNPGNGTIMGMYIPESLIEAFDFGKESPFFYNMEIRGGPASYYLFLGKEYRDILSGYYGVSGFPALPPLFSFGFFGSSMNYVEPDNARERILNYFSTVEKYDIPCEGMYVSSGYLKADDGNRYAFFWNKKKFPDPAGFLRGLSGRGYNLCMNIKPGILSTHPWYNELRNKGYFISDKNGKAYAEYYWGGEASFPDFAKPEAREWWKGKLKENYIENGCTGIWNDNNELELEDSELDAFKDRSLFPVRMVQASYEAFKECNPDIRPWIYSRSGYAGIQRFARTWSGDNVSDWKTLKFNQYQGLGFGLSGMPFYGHDLGGFFGPIPSRELLLRSCQSGVFQPRFVIHSWRESGEPTEPWTYPDILPAITRFIREHYRFIPYIYDCALEASRNGTPIDRPLFLEYPEDSGCRNNQVHSLFGPGVLKILAVDPDETSVHVHLPAGDDWYDPEGRCLHAGGLDVNVEIPLDDYRWFAKAGSVIPTSPGLNTLATGLYPRLDFLVFPPASPKSVEYLHFEDDGVHELSCGVHAGWLVRIVPESAGKGIVLLEKKHDGLKEPEAGRVFSLELPEGFLFTGTSRVHRFDPADYPPGKILSVPYTGKYPAGEKG